MLSHIIAVLIVGVYYNICICFIENYILYHFQQLAGIGILALAIFFRVDGATSKVLQSDSEQRDMFYAVCYVLMAVGGAIMVVGFCGCCGALQESRMLLTMVRYYHRYNTSRSVVSRCSIDMLGFACRPRPQSDVLYVIVKRFQSHSLLLVTSCR